MPTYEYEKNIINIGKLRVNFLIRVNEKCYYDSNYVNRKKEKTYKTSIYSTEYLTLSIVDIFSSTIYFSYKKYVELLDLTEELSKYIHKNYNELFVDAHNNDNKSKKTSSSAVSFYDKIDCNLNNYELGFKFDCFNDVGGIVFCFKLADTNEVFLDWQSFDVFLKVLKDINFVNTSMELINFHNYYSSVKNN